MAPNGSVMFEYALRDEKTKREYPATSKGSEQMSSDRIKMGLGLVNTGDISLVLRTKV